MQWFPTLYESNFLETCYRASDEDWYATDPLQGNVPGLPPGNQYRTGFLKDTKAQGSGRTSDHVTWLHYDGGGSYSEQPCAKTGTNTCALDNETVAVDNKTVPKKAALNVYSVGVRYADDVGGTKILGYHLDLYYGFRKADCAAWGNSHSGTIEFDAYTH